MTKHPDVKIAGVWETFTPKRAEEALNTYNTNNRSLRHGRVEQYAADMKNGRWFADNPAPIMFYKGGALADGQHRLWAVVESGVPMRFVVMREVPLEVALNIDTGLSRNLMDNARISGTDKALTPNLIAAAGIFHHGRRMMGRALSNAERLALIHRYSVHLLWAEQHRPRKPRVSNAVISAAVARAHVHERNLERLAQFCTILGGGIPLDPITDSAAHTFRNFAMSSGDLANTDARDLFLKTMNSIRYFMRGKQLTVIKAVKEEAYPVKVELRHQGKLL